MGHQGFCKPVNHLSKSCWKEEKMVLNAVVSVFLGVNKDGQLQRIGHEFQSELQKHCNKTLMIL